MKILIYVMLFTGYILNCLGIDFIDIPGFENRRRGMKRKETTEKPSTLHQRRYLVETQKSKLALRSGPGDDDKDINLKEKISTLVQQTLHDTESKIKSAQNMKQHFRNEPPYKIGFVLSLVKKTRDVMNELFNVAVKHRDEWKALEQLKIFELIVHTNVDTTNLVRQLVEIHVKYTNSTH